MILYLIEYLNLGALNNFLNYLTVRTGLALFTSFFFILFFGPFLIKRIRHDFSTSVSPPKHTMHMGLVKDSLEEPLPSPTDNIEPQRENGYTSEYAYSSVNLSRL